MSDELIPRGEEAPATMLSPETIHRIQAILDDSVQTAEAAMEIIRAAAGPQPGKVPQDMIVSINYGTGYLRQARDTIERIFKEWATIVRQQECAHDRGLLHTPRRSFCKLCGWEHVHDRTRNEFVPVQRVGEPGEATP
jgi:hypothetical protein